MARQPFLPTYRGRDARIGVIDLPARLSELIGACAANWTMADLALSLVMGSLLGVENAASVAVFTSLRNARAQRDALTAAAEATISGRELIAFNALLRVHSSLDSQRNDVVHGTWGASSAIGPDAVLWMSAQHYAVMHINDYHHVGRTPDFDRTAQMTRNMFVYPYRDIEILVTEIASLYRVLGNFHAGLRYRGQTAGDHSWAMVESFPAVQQAFAT